MNRVRFFGSCSESVHESVCCWDGEWCTKVQYLDRSGILWRDSLEEMWKGFACAGAHGKVTQMGWWKYVKITCNDGGMTLFGVY